MSEILDKVFFESPETTREQELLDGMGDASDGRAVDFFASLSPGDRRFLHTALRDCRDVTGISGYIQRLAQAQRNRHGTGIATDPDQLYTNIELARRTTSGIATWPEVPYVTESTEWAMNTSGYRDEVHVVRWGMRPKTEDDILRATETQIRITSIEAELRADPWFEPGRY